MIMEPRYSPIDIIVSAWNNTFCKMLMHFFKEEHCLWIWAFDVDNCCHSSPVMPPPYVLKADEDLKQKNSQTWTSRGQLYFVDFFLKDKSILPIASYPGVAVYELCACVCVGASVHKFYWIYLSSNLHLMTCELCNPSESDCSDLSHKLLKIPPLLGHMNMSFYGRCSRRERPLKYKSPRL